MNVFVDTSAFYAVLDRDDENHRKAAPLYEDILEKSHRIMTSNYILVETMALLQSRIGMGAVRAFHKDLLPMVHVSFVTPDIHFKGVSALLTASKRRLSLVDCISFEIIREIKPDRVFAFDPHFKEQGFRMLA